MGMFPDCAAACRAVLTRPGPELGRGFAAARNFIQPAHPSCSQLLPAAAGWPGNAGRGWACLKAGFTFAFAENLFMFNSITRQTHELFQNSSAHGNTATFTPVVFNEGDSGVTVSKLSEGRVTRVPDLSNNSENGGSYNSPLRREIVLRQTQNHRPELEEKEILRRRRQAGLTVYSWTKTALFFFRNFSTTRLPLTEVWVRTASGLASL